MTKAKHPMGALDRVELAIANAAQQLFPNDQRLGADEHARLVQDATEFKKAATEIMDLVDDAARDAVIGRALEAAKVDGSHRAELRIQTKEQIIKLLALTCLRCMISANAGFQDIERQRQEIKKTRALIARKGRAAPSKSVDDIVSRHATRLWRKKPSMRKTAHGTAAAIVEDVNADLQKGDLRKLGAKEALSVSEITKRVRRIPQKLA